MCALLSWTGTLIVARELGTRDYGSFAFVFNLLGLIGLVADFETTRVVMAELGRGGDGVLSHVAGRFITFRVVLGTVAYLLGLTIVLIGPYSSTEVAGVAIGGLSFFIASASWSLISICQAKQWLRMVAVALVAGAAVQFAIILGLHSSGEGTLLRYIVPYVVSDAVVLVWIAVALRGTLSLRPRVDVPAWRRWFVEAAPLAVGSALGALYFRIDGLMITLVLHGDESRVALALYQTGYKFSDLLAFLAPALIAATLPLFAKAWPDDREGFRHTFSQALVLVLVVAVFAVAMFCVFAEPAVLLWGEQFRAASTAARLLVIGQACNFLTQLVYVVLVSAHRRRFYPIATLCGLAVNVGLNLILIRRYGGNGAAVATIITEVVVLTLLLGQVRDLPLRPLPWRSIVVIAVAAGSAAAVGTLVYALTVWPLGVVAGTVVYLVALHGLGVSGPGGLRALWRNSRIIV